MTLPQAVHAIALSAVLVLAPRVDSEPDAELRAVAGRVAATAGRAAPAATTGADVAPDAIRSRVGRAFDAIVPASTAAALRDEIQALGFAGADGDLRARAVEFAAAAFDRASEPRDLAGQIQATRLFAIESVAARCDAAAFIAAGKDSDARLARLAVVVGLGVDLADRTLRDHADEIAKATASRAVPDSATWDPFGALARVGASPWEIGVWSFAMIDGAAFVRFVRDRDASALDRLLTEPPDSTELVIDPQRWIDRTDAPHAVAASDLSAALGAGWKLVADDVVGAMQLELWCSTEGEPVRAIRAVAGWAGDRCRVYRDGADVLLQWTGEFDSEADAEHAAEAIAKVFARRTLRATGRRPDESEGTARRRVDGSGRVIDVVDRKDRRVVWLSGAAAARPELMTRALGG